MAKFFLKSNFFLRLITGLLLITAVCCAVFSPFLFYGVIVITTGLMVYEWTVMCRTGGFKITKKKFFLTSGFLYIFIGSLCAISLWQEKGPWLILWVLSVTCGTDILAYCTGKLLKGPLLCPSISPGKTWSGAWGGAIGGACIGYALLQWGPQILTYNVGNILPESVKGHQRFVLFIILAIIAILGDLLESWAKRQCHVKDSSALIPGHGGVLDRMDSILPCMIAVKLLSYY